MWGSGLAGALAGGGLGTVAADGGAQVLGEVLQGGQRGDQGGFLIRGRPATHSEMTAARCAAMRW